MQSPDNLPKVNTNLRWLCWFRPHKFVKFSGGFKRVCVRCDEEQWVFSNPYPKIGQPKYFWQSMNFRKLKF